MNWQEVFGCISVTLMLVFYALEHRSRWWVFAFALACFASSTYAALIGSVPFAVVEAVWGIVALRRWMKGKTLIF